MTPAQENGKQLVMVRNQRDKLRDQLDELDKKQEELQRKLIGPCGCCKKACAPGEPAPVIKFHSVQICERCYVTCCTDCLSRVGRILCKPCLAVALDLLDRTEVGTGVFQ